MAQVNKDSFVTKHTRGDYQAAIDGIITKINEVFARHPQTCYLVGLHALAHSMAMLLGPSNPETRADWVRDLPGLLRGNIAMLDKAFGRGPRRKPFPGMVNDSHFELTIEEGAQVFELLGPMGEAMTGQPRLVGLLALSRMMSAILFEAPDEIMEHTCQRITEVVDGFIAALDQVMAELRAEQRQSTNH
jgi:hypothetical protein